MSNGMPAAAETSLVLGTNSKVASGSTKRRIAHAVAIRSTWIRSRVMKCTASSAHHAVRDGGQLAADALAKDQAAVDRQRRLDAAGRVEVVTVADLAEAPLQGDQLLLGPEPGRVGGVWPRVLRSAVQVRDRARTQLPCLRAHVVDAPR